MTAKIPGVKFIKAYPNKDGEMVEVFEWDGEIITTYSKVITITPKMAERCLSKNPNNRPLREGDIGVYAEDMRRGYWMLTHQGIAFDTLGNLIDGQHRLWAIIRASVPVLMRVTRGLPREWIKYIDNMTPRRFNNYSKFLGVDANHQDLAIARILEYGMLQRYPKLSINDQFSLVEKYKQGIEFGKSLHPNSKTRIAPVMSVVIMAWYSRDGIEGTLKRFIDVVNNGEGYEKKELAAKKLRDFLLTTGAMSSTKRTEIYCKTGSALDNFIAGIGATKLYARDPQVLFPIPLSIKEGWD